MNLDLLAIIALVLAAIPCGLFLLNLCVYRPILGGRRRDEAHLTIQQERSEPTRDGCYGISVLIPARNEETNIRATLEAAQEALSAEAQRRDPAAFDPLLRGGAGQGGIYDLWRALKSKWRGEHFSKEHGLK